MDEEYTSSRGGLMMDGEIGMEMGIRSNYLGNDEVEEGGDELTKDRGIGSTAKRKRLGSYG